MAINNTESTVIIYALLSSSSELAALVGDRIFPMRAPQNANPNCITFMEISVSPVGIKGYAKNEQARVQIDVFAPTQSNAGHIAKLVRKAMEPVLPATIGGVFTQVVEFDDQQNMIEESAEDTGMYRISQDYLIYYNRTA